MEQYKQDKYTMDLGIQIYRSNKKEFYIKKVKKHINDS